MSPTSPHLYEAMDMIIPNRSQPPSQGIDNYSDYSSMPLPPTPGVLTDMPPELPERGRTRTSSTIILDDKSDGNLSSFLCVATVLECSVNVIVRMVDLINGC